MHATSTSTHVHMNGPDLVLISYPCCCSPNPVYRSRITLMRRLPRGKPTINLWKLWKPRSQTIAIARAPEPTFHGSLLSDAKYVKFTLGPSAQRVHVEALLAGMSWIGGTNLREYINIKGQNPRLQLHHRLLVAWPFAHLRQASSRERLARQPPEE